MYVCSISTSTVFTKVCMIKFLLHLRYKHIFIHYLHSKTQTRFVKTFILQSIIITRDFVSLTSQYFIFLVAEKSQGDAMKLFRSHTKMYPINYHSQVQESLNTENNMTPRSLMSFEKLSSFNQTYITFTYMSPRREWRCYSKICLLAQFVLTLNDWLNQVVACSSGVVL